MKEKFIEVHDNIVSPYIVDFIENIMFGRINTIQVPYYYGENLTGPTNIEINQHTLDFGFGNTFYEYNMYKELTANILQPIYQFCNFRQINIINILRSRYYFQPPTGKNVTQALHIDADYPHWVFLYYINDSDGDTVFYNEDRVEIKRVSPKKGRIAFFNGSILHAATKPSTHHRAVINMNFEGEFYNLK